jgi:hypothetical protein
METIFTVDHFLTLMVTLVVVTACVSVHYEGLRGLSSWASNTGIRPRSRILVLIFGILSLHVVEVWLFALGYAGLLQFPEFGQIAGGGPLSLIDYVYFSAVSFTTLGFGELVPQGHVRLLTGMEGLVGLTMITWSASFTFLEMQRFWGRG